MWQSDNTMFESTSDTDQITLVRCCNAGIFQPWASVLTDCQNTVFQLAEQCLAAGFSNTFEAVSKRWFLTPWALPAWFNIRNLLAVFWWVSRRCLEISEHWVYSGRSLAVNCKEQQSLVRQESCHSKLACSSGFLLNWETHQWGVKAFNARTIYPIGI